MKSTGMGISTNTRSYGGAIVGSKLLLARRANPPHARSKSFQRSLHATAMCSLSRCCSICFAPCFTGCSAEKFSNVGLKLGSNQADDAFAHARDGVIRILVEHFIPVFFHKGPRLCSRVLIEENAAHEIGRILRAHFAANGHLQRSVDQVRLAEGSESEKITCLFLRGLSVFKPGVETCHNPRRSPYERQSIPKPEPSCARRRLGPFRIERIAPEPAVDTPCPPPPCREH